MKLSEIKLGGRIFQLSIGYSGSGKTVGAASYPKPLVVLDLDGRVEPLVKMYPNDGDTISVEKFGPTEFDRFWQFMKKVQAGDLPYKTVVLDSLTSLARMTLNYSVGLRGSNTGRTTAYKKVGVIDMLEIEDFGAEGRLLGYVIDCFRSSKANFIMSAHLIHTTETNIKDKNKTELKQLLTGGKKVAAEIPAYFNEVYYHYSQTGFDGGKPEFFISTVTLNDIPSKTALPLPTTINHTMKNPGDPGLFQKIQIACKEAGVEIG